MSRNFLLTVILPVFLLAGSMTGCTSTPKTRLEEPSTLTIAYEEDSLLYLPLYVAIQNKYFEQEDLQIKLQKYPSPKDAVEGVLTGKYDLLLHGPEVGFFLYQQGQKNQICFLAQCAVRHGLSLLSRGISPTTSLFSWDHTKGKVILGHNISDLREIILENLLKKKQLRPQFDVHLINNLPWALRTGAFQSGTAHFFLGNEPETSFLEIEGNCQVAIFLEDYTSPLLSTVFSAAKEKVLLQKEDYQKFIKAMTRALAWIETQSPLDLATIATGYFPGYGEKILIRGIARYKNIGCWPVKPEIEEESLQSLHDFLLQAGELNAALPDSALKDFLESPFTDAE